MAKPEAEWEAPAVGEIVQAVAVGERVSRLEGSYEHMAAKAELAEAFRKIDQVETRLIRWIIAIVGVATGVVIAVDRLAN